MEREFESTRDFTKEKMLEERAATAQEIRRTRQEHFEKQKTLKERLASVLQDAETKQTESGEVRTRIESAEQQLNDQSENAIKRLFYYRSINKLKTEIDSGRVTEEKITQELADLEAARQETEELSEDRSSLDEARQKLDQFYGRADETWNNYEDDREAGDVGSVLRQRGTLLVHAFQNPVFSPSDENGVLRKDVGWRDKLDLLMALEPSISASAVNENNKDTFAPVGVLLGEGQIIAASSRDLGTKIADRTSRYIPNTMRAERVRDQIDKALEVQPDKSGWTEFVVNQPKVAGVFFRVESNGKLADLEIGSDTNVGEVVAAAQERNLPIFALRDGVLHRMEPDEAVSLGKPIESTRTERAGLNQYDRKTIEYPSLAANKEVTSSEAIADLTSGADANMREAIIERFMTNSPFQLRRFPEAYQVESRAEGRARYRLLTSSVETQSENKTTISRNTAGNVHALEVTVLSTIPGPTSLEHVVRLDDGSLAIWEQSRNPVSDKSRFRAGSAYSQDRLIGSETHLNISGLYIPTERPVTNIVELITAAKNELDKAVDYAKDDNESIRKMSESYISRISCFLRGVAEEARANRDDATASMAEEAVGQSMSAEQYQDLIQRRVSENGTFRLTREELVGDQ